MSLAGCGTTHGKGRAGTHIRTATGTAARTPRYSPAKRRYLDHFKTNCGTAAAAADVGDAQLQKLIGQIGKGDPHAIPRLAGYLTHLANEFEGSLRYARGLGHPPNPDSDQGLAYLREAARVITSVRSLSAALTRIQPSAVENDIHQVATAGKATQTAAERYGIPNCKSRNSPPTQASGPAI
jgi:hypothetical protein